MRVVIADDSMLLREGLARLLVDAGCDVVATAKDARRAVSRDGAGQSGFGHRSDVAVVVDALRRVVEGECVVDPTIVSTLLRRPLDPGPLDRLSSREVEVLGLMAEGRSTAAIADRLVMSPKTVEAHVRQILQKLDLHASPDHHRRVLAVLHYLRSAP